MAPRGRAVFQTLLLVLGLSGARSAEAAQDADQLRSEAIAALQEQRFDIAIDRFESLVRLQPREPALWSNLGYCYRHAGRRAEAKEAFERALALNEEDAYATLQLGHLAWEAGDLRRAESWYQRVLTIDPEQPAARQNLSALREQLAIAERVDAHRARVTTAFWLAIVFGVAVTGAGLWWGRKLAAG